MSGSVIAIITARGGSKGVLKKNIRMLSGKPLIAYSIVAALECPYVSRCLVTTDDPEIKQISLKWGAEVIDRPEELSTDISLSQDVVRHALEAIRKESELPEYFVLLQPTSPLRNATHLRECLESLLNSNNLSAMSVTGIEHHPYKCLIMEHGNLYPFHDVDSLDKPRQLLPQIYRPNGAIYALKCADFLSCNTFYVPPVMPYYMDQQFSIDIDTEIDFVLAEQIIMSLNLHKSE